jgi:hypothetical protein
VVSQPPAGSPPNLKQQFRLQKIGELEAFLRSEVEYRSRFHKKYRRAEHFLDDAFAMLSMALALETRKMKIKTRRSLRGRHRRTVDAGSSSLTLA